MYWRMLVIDSIERVIDYAVRTDVRLDWRMLVIDSVQRVLHYDIRLHWQLAVVRDFFQLVTSANVVQGTIVKPEDNWSSEECAKNITAKRTKGVGVSGRKQMKTRSIEDANGERVVNVTRQDLVMIPIAQRESISIVLEYVGDFFVFKFILK